MHLHEEYIQRHSLDIPVILYDQRVKIFLRRQDPRNWRVLSLDWEFDYGHPGYWICSVIEPIHSSYGKSRNWRQLFRPRKVYWDEYEEFIKKAVMDFQGWEIVEGSKNQELFCWEVLLYTCDNWLARSGFMENRRFLKNLQESLDPKMSFDDRWSAHRRALEIIDTDMSVIEFYNYNICNSPSDTNWFAELMNNGEKELLARAG